MSTGDETNLIDDDHSAHLCDVGQRDYLAATVVRADGSAHLVLAQRDAIGDLDVRYDPDTAQAPHEQTGPLPLKYVRRLTISARTHRCGRRTKSGSPCRTQVARPGDACTWHRTSSQASEATKS